MVVQVLVVKLTVIAVAVAWLTILLGSPFGLFYIAVYQKNSIDSNGALTKLINCYLAAKGLITESY